METQKCLPPSPFRIYPPRHLLYLLCVRTCRERVATEREREGKIVRVQKSGSRQFTTPDGRLLLMEHCVRREEIRGGIQPQWASSDLGNSGYKKQFVYINYPTFLLSSSHEGRFYETLAAFLAANGEILPGQEPDETCQCKRLDPIWKLSVSRILPEDCFEICRRCCQKLYADVWLNWLVSWKRTKLLFIYATIS